VSYLQEVVPPDRQNLIADLFEHITLYDNRVRTARAEPLGDGRFRVHLEVEAHKLRADGQGRESEVPLDDWVDVAVFGEREPGGVAAGKLLVLEKRRLAETESTFEIVVDERPRRAGVDPFHKLVDRNPDDNTTAVVVASGS
jgi:hypothetical protein